MKNPWSLFASVGGKAGKGKSKLRSPEHYTRIAALASEARSRAAKARREAAGLETFDSMLTDEGITPP